MANLRKNKIFKTLAIALTLAILTGLFAGCGKDTEEETTQTTAAPTTQAPATEPYLTGNINPLTGEANYPEELLKNRPVLISVENHKDARPQWGITDADIVWEMEAEGGITRMLLMFADASRIPDQVGPTRSARHYFVELVEGFDAIFVHFGGSPQAYTQLDNRGTDHIDGMTDSGAFARDNSRNVSSEHRAYTTGEKVMNAIENKGFRTEADDDYLNPFKFNATAKKLADGDCNSMVVAFSSYATYTYNYSAEDNLYYSTLNGNSFKDSDGNQQSFTNLLICYADKSSLGDAKGRISFDLSEGEGVYVSNGTYQKITWEKGDYSDMMKFYDADGKELALNAGRTYIGIVASSQEGACTIA